MNKVSFKQMKDGTKDDYLLLDRHEKKYIEGTADRIIKFMSCIKMFFSSNINHVIITFGDSFNLTSTCSNSEVLNSNPLKFAERGKLL